MLIWNPDLKNGVCYVFSPVLWCTAQCLDFCGRPPGCLFPGRSVQWPRRAPIHFVGILGSALVPGLSIAAEQSKAAAGSFCLLLNGIFYIWCCGDHSCWSALKNTAIVYDPIDSWAVVVSKSPIFIKIPVCDSGWRVAVCCGKAVFILCCSCLCFWSMIHWALA